MYIFLPTCCWWQLRYQIHPWPKSCPFFLFFFCLPFKNAPDRIGIYLPTYLPTHSSDKNHITTASTPLRYGAALQFGSSTPCSKIQNESYATPTSWRVLISETFLFWKCQAEPSACAQVPTRQAPQSQWKLRRKSESLPTRPTFLGSPNSPPNDIFYILTRGPLFTKSSITGYRGFVLFLSYLISALIGHKAGLINCAQEDPTRRCNETAQRWRWSPNDSSAFFLSHYCVATQVQDLDFVLGMQLQTSVLGNLSPAKLKRDSELSGLGCVSGRTRLPIADLAGQGARRKRESNAAIPRP